MAQSLARGNWRFGVYNALLGPVQARLLSLPDFEYRTETVQRLSNYNVATAEYILPNNGYVHLSNSTLLAGRGYTNAAPALNFQVRDRSNTYEARGGTDWQYNLRNRDKSIGYRYNFSLARINRRWYGALLGVPRVIACMDADAAGAGAAAQLAMLSGAVKSVQVPSGKDLNEFYQQTGENTVKEWLQTVIYEGPSA